MNNRNEQRLAVIEAHQQKIAEACLRISDKDIPSSEEPKVYADRQRLTLKQIIDEVKKNTELTTDLIRKIHFFYSCNLEIEKEIEFATGGLRFVYENMPQENKKVEEKPLDNKSQLENNPMREMGYKRRGLPVPGQFRESFTGTNPNFTQFTQDGIKEILEIIKQEQDAHFQQYKGTVLAPGKLQEDQIIPDFSKAIHTGTLHLDSNTLANSIESLAKKLYANEDRQDLMLFGPRTNETVNLKDFDQRVSAYIKRTLNSLIEQFNKDINASRTPDEKIEKITAFIKNGMRKLPFEDQNDGALAFGLLNFLLLKHEIGYCLLTFKERWHFIGSSLQESVAIVKQHLVQLDFNQRLTITSTQQTTDKPFGLFSTTNTTKPLRDTPSNTTDQKETASVNVAKPG